MKDRIRYVKKIFVAEKDLKIEDGSVFLSVDATP
jgi:hypothetical protein